MSMSISMKKATTKTNLNHNNREFTEREKERNSHIDYSRSDENKYLVQGDIKKLYEREFGEALKNYNEKQTRSDRKIEDYYKHIEASKKTATQQEMIIQIGDKDDFSTGNEFNRDLANDVLEEWFNDFEERNPNLKVYNAVIHNDEASPHLHLNFVPVADDYKRGLEKQVAFDRAIKGQDQTLNKTRPFEDWREKEVNLLENKLKERGIERKLVGTNEYKDVNEYKQKKDELKEINQEIENTKEHLNKLTQVVASEETEPLFLKKEKDLFRKETGNYVLSPEQYEEITKQINSSAVLKKDYDLMQTGEMIESRDRFIRYGANLKEELGKRLNESREVKKENDKLKSENQTLRVENNSLKESVRSLKGEIAQIYESTKDFLKEHTKDLDSFKNIFNGLIDRFKRDYNQSHREPYDEIGKPHFEIIDDVTTRNENIRERDDGMEL